MKHLTFIFFIITLCACQPEKEAPIKKPNFLFCIADDWSYPHAGVYGDKVIKTPNFDRLAKGGMLFDNAYTAASSCSPSRAAILTGQEIYRLEAGGLLFGVLPQKFPIYTTLLQNEGYKTGFTGKGYAPGTLSEENWVHNPAGPIYNDIDLDAPDGIRKTDYAENFKAFIKEKKEDKPFCFWYGASEPHRKYDYGIGKRNGYDLDKIKVPGFLPDDEVSRNDIADYYFEVEWFDDHLGKIVDHLESIGELENTVIIITSDNGMPFPRAKSNLYSYGDRMPLAIYWKDQIKPNQKSDALVSLTDIAPTILEIAGLDVAENMTGTSLWPLLNNREAFKKREHVISAMERHTICRPDTLGYPMRAIHDETFVYIHNFEVDRWPGGDPNFDAWPQGFYGDVDDGASKTLFEENPGKWPELFEHSFGKRPEEEFYDIKSDPYNLNNLANDPAYKDKMEILKSKMFDYLRATNDPRMSGDSPWDNYSYTGRTEWEY